MLTGVVVALEVVVVAPTWADQEQPVKATRAATGVKLHQIIRAAAVVEQAELALAVIVAQVAQEEMVTTTQSLVRLLLTRVVAVATCKILLTPFQHKELEALAAAQMEEILEESETLVRQTPVVVVVATTTTHPAVEPAAPAL